MALFTKETAAEMAKRSHAPDSARHKPAITQEEPAPIPQTPVEPAETVQDFTALRLMRVRTQLDRLDAMAAECSDTKQLKELADATSRLQEQERQLAGRPLPGTLKPSSRTPSQSRRTAAPLGVDTTIPSGSEQSSDPK